MTTDDRQIDVDPLGAIRQQLVGAAGSRRIQGRQRQRQRMLLAGALSAGLLMTGTAVAAVGGFATGVAAIDRLLQVDGPSMGHDIGPGEASDPIVVPLTTGSLTLSAYPSSDGSVCVAQGVTRASGDGPEGGLGGCLAVPALASDLSRAGIVWASATTIGDHRVFVGYADGPIADVRVRGAEAPTVRLTPPWAPPGSEGRPMRLLAIYDRAPAITRSNDDPHDDDVARLVAHYPDVDVLDDSGSVIPYERSAAR